MIDTHCHIDLYKNPFDVLNECEKAGIVTIGMTNLPSHFEIGYKHIQPYKKARLALGMHPLYSEQHAKEFPAFVENISKTSYIGEIGLDFSKEGIATKNMQIDSFKKILNVLKGKRKLLSLHSRRAEKEVLEYLIEFEIKSAIFHWYSGPVSLIDKIIEAGYYFSINTAMIKSEAGRKIIDKIPINNILTETDGPFIETNGRKVKPSDVKLVEDYLSCLWKKSQGEVSLLIRNNFANIILDIR
jgi:TatD DNase family protein